MWPWQYLSRIMFGVNRNGDTLATIRDEFRDFKREIRTSLKFLKTRAAYVGPLSIEVTGEHDMSLKFKVGLPPVTAGDVVNGELSVKIDAGEPLVFVTFPSDTEVSNEKLTGRDGATVELSYVLIDDAGNRSQPREFVGQLLDTIAPPQPGELALVVTEEVADELPSE